MVRSRIHRLSTAVANQIAAGEVIERPASVVKELLENSLDAEASKITIDIVSSGLSLIRVTDDGVGIEKEDLLLAISPHATSKLSAIEDLQSLSSMGFRGEALASIASVAHCTLCSGRIGAAHSWQLIASHQDTDYPLQIAPYRAGTMIEIRDLFFNTPARRRFLKSDKTEFEVIYQVVKRAALSNPQVTFTLTHNQKQLFHAPKVAIEAWEKRAQKILGQEFYDQAIWLDEVADGLRLQGAIAKPSYTRSDITAQYFFVNQRPVRDRVVNHAVAQAFGDRLEVGRHPCYVLMLSILPQEVDVNVHPSKYEVRFVDQRSVHDFIYRSLSRHLSPVSPEIVIAEIPLPLASMSSNVAASVAASGAVRRPLFPARSSNPVTTSDPYRQVRERYGRAIGIIAERYLILEKEDEVVFVDLLKTKENSVFHFLQTQACVRCKPLLIPQYYDISTELIQTEKQLKYGFEFVLQPNNKVQLRAVPAVLHEAPPLEWLTQWLACFAKDPEGDEILSFISQISAKQWLANADKRQEWQELLSNVELTEKVIKSVSVNAFQKLFEELSDAR